MLWETHGISQQAPLHLVIISNWKTIMKMPYIKPVTKGNVVVLHFVIL